VNDELEMKRKETVVM